jgi:hypothetical protein
MMAHNLYAMKTTEDFIAFAEQTKTPLNPRDFLELASIAARIAKENQDRRDILAYHLVSLGAYIKKGGALDVYVQQVRDLATDLELPDSHVYTKDGDITEKWERLRAISEEGIRS